MGLGRVCDKHNEWCQTGECRWCEQPKAEAAPQAAVMPRWFEGIGLPAAAVEAWEKDFEDASSGRGLADWVKTMEEPLAAKPKPTEALAAGLQIWKQAAQERENAECIALTEALAAKAKVCAQEGCWCRMESVTSRGTVVHLPIDELMRLHCNDWFEGGPIRGPIVGIDRLHCCIHIANAQESSRIYGDDK